MVGRSLICFKVVKPVLAVPGSVGLQMRGRGRGKSNQPGVAGWHSTVGFSSEFDPNDGRSLLSW